MRLWCGRFSIIALVLVLYAFCAANQWTAISKTPQQLYALLADSFIHGHTSLPIIREVKLPQEVYGYTPYSTARVNLYDTSLYQGHYYLYFGVLPILTVILPFKWLTGYYPPDALSAAVFAALGFIASFWLVTKIKDDFFPHVSEKRVYLAGLLLGLTNNSVCLITLGSRFYELAVLSAFAVMSVALVFLYLAVTRGFLQRYLCGFSLCLALTILGRPQFIVVAFTIPCLLMIWIWREKKKKQTLTTLLTLFSPLLLILCSMAIYNWQRFGSFWEFGFQYQLHLQQNQPASLSYIPYRLADYFLQLPTSLLGFPATPVGNKAIALEYIVGVLFYCPLLLALVELPKLSYRKALPLTRFISLLVCIPALMLACLSVLSFYAQRYETDFLPYLLIMAIVTWWWRQHDALHQGKSLRTDVLWLVLSLIGLLLSIKLALPQHLLSSHGGANTRVAFDDGSLFLYIISGRRLTIINLWPVLFVIFYGLLAIQRRRWGQV